MNPGYRVRRATTDDLGALVALWRSAHLPPNQLDKAFTEFQLAEDAEGRILGGIGLRISGSDGLVHSEAFSDFGLTDRLRPLLWERLLNVANNHGLFRLWTQEPAPFWKKQCGFAAPTAEAIARVPAQFVAGEGHPLMLQLREDRAAPEALEAEFTKFKAEENERAARMFQQARLLKGIAIALSVLLFLFVAIGLAYLFRYRDRIAPTTYQPDL